MPGANGDQNCKLTFATAVTSVWQISSMIGFSEFKYLKSAISRGELWDKMFVLARKKKTPLPRMFLQVSSAIWFLRIRVVKV
jgi:hypothetical protein